MTAWSRLAPNPIPYNGPSSSMATSRRMLMTRGNWVGSGIRHHSQYKLLWKTTYQDQERPYTMLEGIIQVMAMAVFPVVAVGKRHIVVGEIKQ